MVVVFGAGVVVVDSLMVLIVGVLISVFFFLFTNGCW